MTISRLNPPHRCLPPLFVAVAVVAIARAGIGAEDNAAGYAAALRSISAEAVGANVNLLADDNMEGRESGSRGGYAAADYLVSELKRIRLAGAAADGGYFQPFAPNYRNILAVLEGSDPKLKHEYILVGAHYDHVGYGNRFNSLGPIGYVHNGADDNGSGVSGVLRTAEAMTMLAERPKRSILFAFWDAEERGLLGSKHWRSSPTIPVKNLVLAVNVDMIGRLRDEHLYVYGTRTGVGLRRMLSERNQQYGFDLDFSWQLRRNADHYTFFEMHVPVIMFHTGEHDNYHRPSDKPALINTSGLSRVGQLLFETLWHLAEAPALPAFREASQQESPESEKEFLQSAPTESRLGVAWKESDVSDRGIVLSEIQPDGPAARAGCQLGDRVARFDGQAVQSTRDLLQAVRRAGKTAKMEVWPAGKNESTSMEVRLAGQPIRLGIQWRHDDAEPGTLVLTSVLPHSPADDAGLDAGDRIYRVAGKPIVDETVFIDLVAKATDSLEMVVERRGRIRRTTIQFKAQPIRRAA